MSLIYHLSWPAWVAIAVTVIAIVMIVIRLGGRLFGGTPGQDVLIAGGFVPDPFYGIGWFGVNEPIQSADLYHLDSTSFSNAGDMGIGRVGQTATKLNNGTVLIAGGADQSTALYNRLTRSFVDGPNLNQPRQFHTATLLTDGTVLIAGGNADGRAEIFDDSGNGSFSLLNNPMSFPRSGHTATMLADGRVLVAGGYDHQSGAATRTAEIYDPASKTFTLVIDAQGGTNALQQARIFHTASLLDNNKVLIAGGLDRISADAEAAQRLSTGEIYDPDFLPDTLHGAFVLVGNPAPGPGSQMTEGRVMHTQISIAGGQAVIAGGTSWFNGAVIGLKTADLYVSARDDPYGAATGSFLAIPGGLAYPRGGHAATTLPDGTVLIAGGIDATVVEGAGTLRNDAELYDPNGGDPSLPVQPGALRLIVLPSSSDSSPAQPHMQHPRFGATATLLDLV